MCVCVCVCQSYGKGKEGLQEETAVHKIRITLTSRNVRSLEKGGLSFSLLLCVREKERGGSLFVPQLLSHTFVLVSVCLTYSCSLSLSSVQ